jgi:preprotein translocase subunit SecD
MAREAEFAFRQAWALCPYSPYVVKRYTDFLKSQNRTADAGLVATSAAKFPAGAESHSEKSRGPADEPAKPLVFEMRLVADGSPDDAQRMTLVWQDPSSGQTKLEPLYLKKEVLLDQTALQSAQAVKNPMGKPQIELTLTDAGRKRFADVTRQNIGKRLAIVIDGRVCSAPVIQAEISGGKAEITGNFSEHEAQALAGKINGVIAR